jgi:hypothetical protein
MVASDLRLGESSGSVTRYRLLRTNGAPAKPFGLSGERPTSLAVPTIRAEPSNASIVMDYKPRLF